MKIAFFMDALSGGGAERIVQTLANYMQGKKHQVVIFLRHAKENTYPLYPGVQIFYLKGAKYFAQDLSDMLAMQIDIFSFHAYWNTYNFQIADALLEKGKKVTFTEHNIFYHLYWEAYISTFVPRRVETWKKADALTVLSSYDYQIHSSVLDNVVYMPNPNTFSSDVPLQSNYEKYIIAVARLEPQKRVDKVLHVFAKICPLYSDWRLLVLGDGTLRMELVQLAKDLGIAEQVSFLGAVSNVKDYYAKSSIHVMTSDFEGWGLALTEAKEFGIPSVLMELPCFKDLLLHGEDGFMVAQDDIETMAKHILFLINHPEQIQAMGKKAQEHVKKYNVDKIGKRWEDLFALIVNQPKQEVLSVIKTQYAPAQVYPSKEITADFVRQYNILYERLCEAAPYYKRVKTSKILCFIFWCMNVLDFARAMGWRKVWERLIFRFRNH
jgi:glycosyltransferase involved in cell wall biosynthesis